MNDRYCYWSVATGPDADRMERCVRSARAAGVFRDFHVLTDRPIADCECYDAYESDRAHGLFQLHYLKAGMTRLNYEGFVWLAPDTVFVGSPDDVLGALGRAPIHVPLEVDLTEVPSGAVWQSMELDRVRQLMTLLGVTGSPWLGRSDFWIVRREAIETVYELAVGFWHKAKEAGFSVEVSACLAFAQQMLGADIETHRLVRRPDLWGGATIGHFSAGLPDGKPWLWQPPLGGEPMEIRPAIVGLSRDGITA